MVRLLGSIVGPRGCAATVTAALSSLLAGVAAAQTGAILEGRITDASGAVVREAHVSLVDEGTAVERVALSGSRGEYRFAFLPVGTYRLEVRARLVHGEFSVVSAPGRGTTIRVTIPSAAAARTEQPHVDIPVLT